MRPKLKENIWRVDASRESAILITGGEAYEIPYHPAKMFMKIRSYCTGNLTKKEISARSGINEGDIDALFGSLAASGMIYDGCQKRLPPASGDLVKHCQDAVNIWAQELAANYIGNEIAGGSLNRPTLIGWLIEMYHYIKEFPFSIRVAAALADPPLRQVFERYCEEETGHEVFVLRTLERLGVSKSEVESSAPLLSTRMISMLMRDLFTFEPISVFLVAALVEAQEFDEAAIAAFGAALSRHYGIDDYAMAPYFEHQRIDVDLGHAELLDRYSEWIGRIDLEKIDRVLDSVHDIKHAFELQGIEIKQYYYDPNGKYFPRQPMSLAAIG